MTDITEEQQELLTQLNDEPLPNPAARDPLTEVPQLTNNTAALASLLEALGHSRAALDGMLVLAKENHDKNHELEARITALEAAHANS